MVALYQYYDTNTYKKYALCLDGRGCKQNEISIPVGNIHYYAKYDELPDYIKTHKPLWKIDGIGLKNLFINADSFDEALEIARKTDPNYTGGQVLWKGGD